MKAEAAWGEGNIGDFLDLTRDSEDGFEEGSSSSESESESAGVDRCVFEDSNKAKKSCIASDPPPPKYSSMYQAPGIAYPIRTCDIA